MSNLFTCPSFKRATLPLTWEYPTYGELVDFNYRSTRESQCAASWVDDALVRR